MNDKLMKIFNRLTWIFCILSIIARFYDNTIANILLGVELICVVGVIVLLIVGTIRIKKREKQFREDLRNMALEFLKPNTITNGECDDIKE